MYRKTAFPLSRHRKFCGKRCVAALDGVFRCRCRLQQRWFSSAIQGIPLKKVCRGREVYENVVFSFATQEISREMVCRCSGWCRCRLQERWFSSAIQGIPLKKVCRCMNVPENGVSPFAIQVILRKMVCRGECKARKGKALGQGGMVGR